MIYKNDISERNNTDLSILQELLNNNTTLKSVCEKTHANSISQIIGIRKNSTNLPKQVSSKIIYETTNNPATIDELNPKDTSNLESNSNIRFQNYSINKESNSSYTSYINQQKYVTQKKKRKSSINPFAEANPLSLIESIKEIEDTTIYGRIKLQIKIYDVIIGVLAFISIVLSICDNEMFLNRTDDYINKYMKEKQIEQKTLEVYKQMDKRDLDIEENVVRFLNLFVSLSAAILLVLRYYTEIEMYKKEKKLSEYDGLLSSGLLPYLVLECFICIFFYPPFVNKCIAGSHETIIYVYSLNSIFSIFSFFKIYLIMRLILYSSRYYTKISQAICKNHKITPGFQFILKCEMKLRPFTTMVSLVLFFLLLFGFMTRSLEYAATDVIDGLQGKKGINDLANLTNCIWLIVITITTVGFGDEYPRTDLGRIVVFFGCTFGMLGLGLTIASLSAGIEFTPVEKKAYLKLKKLFDPENVEHKAVNVIGTLLQLRRNLMMKKTCSPGSEYMNNLKEKCFFVFKIKAETQLYKNDYYIARNYSMPINDLIKTMETKLYDNLMSFTKHLDKINLVENDFQYLEKNQHDIQKSIKKVTKYQDEICKYLCDFHNREYIEQKMLQESNEKKMKSFLKMKPSIPMIQINSPSKVMKEPPKMETTVNDNGKKIRNNFLGLGEHTKIKNSPRRNRKRKNSMLSDVPEDNRSFKSEALSQREVKKSIVKSNNMPLRINSPPKKKKLMLSPQTKTKTNSNIISPNRIKQLNKKDSFKIMLIPSINLEGEPSNRKSKRNVGNTVVMNSEDIKQSFLDSN